MQFSGALKKMREGCKIQRDSWPITNYLTVFEDETILIHARGGWGVWKPKSEDLLAADWVEWRPLADPQNKLSFDKDRNEIEPVPMPHNLRDALLEGTPAP
jgi:hypothetical protein